MEKRRRSFTWNTSTLFEWMCIESSKGCDRGCECYGGADADRAGKSLAFYRIGSRQIKSKGMAESDHEKCFARSLRREKRESGNWANEDPSAVITIKMADYLEPDPLSIALEREAQSQALEAVSCLAERDRELIWKHLIQEIQLKDIAHEKGLKPANMRRIYAISLRNLKRVYQEKFE